MKIDVDKNMICLLMTATIIPSVSNIITLTDPEIRYEHYKNALLYAISHYPLDCIVFCENSGYDLSLLKNTISHHIPNHLKVEFLSQNSSDQDANRDIGYCEMTLISKAFEESLLLKEATYIIKLSGRQCCPSIAEIVKFIKSHHEITVISNLTTGLSYSDSRCFAGTHRFFTDYLLPFGDMIDGRYNIWFEHALARAINLAVSKGERWSLPPKPIIILGQSGTTGRIYRHNPASYFIRYINHKLKWYGYGLIR